VRRNNFHKIPKTFLGFVKEITKPRYKSILSLGDYWRLFWEMSIACPVSYLEEGPFRRSLIKSAIRSDSREEAQKAQKIIYDLYNECYDSLEMSPIKLFRNVPCRAFQHHSRFIRQRPLGCIL
jgi:hypothetical protein